MQSMDQDWAGLPKHLQDLILGKLVSLTDYLRFGAVCRSWHSIMKDDISTKQNKLLRQHQVPLLLFPDKEEDKWSIYNVMNKEFSEVKLSLSYKRRFCGSSIGWLVIGNENHTVTLHRPDFITNEENSQVGISIDLPCLFPPLVVEDLEPEIIEYLGEEAYDYHVAKALITADPLANPDNCTIVVIFGGDFEIASIRYNKDTTWMKITNCQQFDDIVYYKNKIYAVGFMGRLISFDPADTSTIECPAPNFLDRLCSKRYLVESYGELWQVERHYSFDDDLNRSTRMFRVYRMDFYQGTWIEIKNLGGAALFVGDSTSIAVLASDFSGCQPNCVYFAHDYVLFHSCKGSDLGMFNVESGSFELHYTIDPTTFFKMVNRPPVWVVPFPKV